MSDFSETADLHKPIEYDNQICLSCHSSIGRFTSLTQREFPDLVVKHAWLASSDLHLRHVRCVDCHTSYDPPNLSHLIKPAKAALRDCARCHSTNTVLLTKLYKYQSRELQTRYGFVNGTLLNNAYVISATRNIFLDRLSVVLAALVFLGIGAQAGLRFVFSRRKLL